MVVEASITGIVRTVLILIGILVVLRFVGRLMIAKRNLDEERKISQRQRQVDKERNEKLRNFGKVNVLSRKKSSPSGNRDMPDAEDVDFEEMK